VAKHRGSPKSLSKKKKIVKTSAPAPPPAVIPPGNKTEIKRDEKGHFVKGQSAYPEKLWKPGQSGNPLGRPKTLTPLLQKRLEQIIRGDKQKRTWGMKFIDEFLKRAIAESDVAAKEIFDRIDGKLRPDPDDSILAAETPMRVLILDVARPLRPAIPALPATPESEED
jgi:hypothetical protein